MNNKTEQYKCGYVALIGKPNAGKSTILNKILNKKVSITSDKPETTQKQILGIKTSENNQIIFVDTPGLHENLYKQQRNVLNKYMGKAVSHALGDVDVILFILSGDRWQKDDEWVLENIKSNSVNNHKNTPVLLVINKIDLIKNKEDLLPFVHEIKDKYNFVDILYVSALKQQGLDKLEAKILDYLPAIEDKSQFYFEPDTITDQNKKSQTAEVVREKIIRLMGAEVPYSVAIEISDFTEDKTKSNQPLLKISAIIWVEREGQRVIIIGNKGEKIKEVGRSARVDLEKKFDCKVFLQLWVKVKKNWSDNERALKSLGFND